jgi:hypothetical protein
MFLTYSLLVSGCQKSESVSRLNQIVDWCGGASFEGVLALDECHKAKNLKESKSTDGDDLKGTRSGGKAASSDIRVGSQTATAVCRLQELLPNARVVYISATGASSPEHLKYAGRLGLWGIGTSFRDSRSFVDGIKEGGVGAMELLAMEVTSPLEFYCFCFLSTSLESLNQDFHLCVDEGCRTVPCTVSVFQYRLHTQTNVPCENHEFFQDSKFSRSEF